MAARVIAPKGHSRRSVSVAAASWAAAVDAPLCSNPVPTPTSLINKEYCFKEVCQTDCMSEIGQSRSRSNVRSQIGLSLVMEALGSFGAEQCGLGGLADHKRPDQEGSHLKGTSGCLSWIVCVRRSPEQSGAARLGDQNGQLRRFSRRGIRGFKWRIFETISRVRMSDRR